MRQQSDAAATGGRRYGGLDIGSQSCEAAIVDENGKLIAHSIMLTGARSRFAGEAALQATLDQTGIARGQLDALISTGYGRDQVEGRSRAVTEITCHARGMRQLLPQARLVLDVGGQDSKAIRVGNDGKVEDFAMNDKCAAGTGRFFEVMVRALEIDLDDLGPLARTATRELTLSHVCTVFAESEVVGMVARGETVADIAAALCRSAAERVLTLARRVGLEGPVALSGGVAKNEGFVAALTQLLGSEPLVPEEPQIVGALGAALIAAGL